MKSNIKIAVLGGGGRTGKYLVNQLLAKEYNLKLLLRNPAQLQTDSSLIEIIHGDAIDEESIRSLIEGCQVVISTIGQRKDEPMVTSTSTAHIIKAMKQFGIERYISVAGLTIDCPGDKKGNKSKLASEWMLQMFPEVVADKQNAFKNLGKSDLNWTLVRVPMIEYTDLERKLTVSLQDCPGEIISATDLANFIVEQIEDDRYLKQAPFVANV